MQVELTPYTPADSKNGPFSPTELRLLNSASHRVTTEFGEAQRAISSARFAADPL
jgi:hypothetical protein